MDYCYLKGVPDSIDCREVSMATLKCGDHPSERPLTGTGKITYLKGYLPWQPNTTVGERRGCKNPQ